VKVEITHSVDRLEGEVLNYLTYDFRTEDGLIRARAYADQMRAVSILGRLNADGSIPDAVAEFQSSYEAAGGAEAAQLAAAQKAFEAMDARRSPEFGAVFAYLVGRFDQVILMGPSGPQTIHETEARA
jgi:hypothetical protein